MLKNLVMVSDRAACSVLTLGKVNTFSSCLYFVYQLLCPHAMNVFFFFCVAEMSKAMLKVSHVVLLTAVSQIFAYQPTSAKMFQIKKKTFVQRLTKKYISCFQFKLASFNL